MLRKFSQRDDSVNLHPLKEVHSPKEHTGPVMGLSMADLEAVLILFPCAQDKKVRLEGGHYRNLIFVFCIPLNLNSSLKHPFAEIYGDC